MSQPNLNEDLNIVANSNIEITLLDGDLNIIQALDDEPNDVGGLTSAELKAKFDEGTNKIKEYINGTLIPEILTEEATEAARASAEAQREANEKQRIKNENARIAEEQARDTAESARADAETERAAAESARNNAEQARESAEQQRQDAETQRQDLETGYVAQSENGAKASESWAVGGTGIREDEETNNAKYWAGYAQAQAESVTVPAAEGVYNVVLQDRAVASDRYALIVENGVLKLLGVKKTLNAATPTLIDMSSGTGWKLAVDNGKLLIEEV